MSITNINATVNTKISTTVVAVKPTDTTQQEIKATIGPVVSDTTKNMNQQQNTNLMADKNQLTKDVVESVTDQLNDFMQSMNTDIKFVLHTKTETLMIQVEDATTHKIIKEFPAHELLDMVARLRDCVGAFLDKKV